MVSVFSQMLNAAIKVAERYDRKFSVMFVDLDRFKLINDTLGHAAGDILLKGVGTQFRRCLRDSDVLARFGGDEFVILLHEVSDVAQVSAVARKASFGSGHADHDSRPRVPSDREHWGSQIPGSRDG